jgi:hypothetical protein
LELIIVKPETVIRWRMSTVTIIDVPAVGIIKGKNLGRER